MTMTPRPHIRTDHWSWVIRVPSDPRWDYLMPIERAQEFYRAGKLTYDAAQRSYVQVDPIGPPLWTRADG